MRKFSTILCTILVAGLWACGGQTEDEGMEADTTAMEDTTAMAPDEGAAGAMSTPEWMTVDATAMTVTMDIQAGGSDVNNYWNYNGLYAGHGSISPARTA